MTETPDPDERADLDEGSRADELSGLDQRMAGLVHGLWRAVHRATHAREHLPSLSESQVTVLHQLVAAGPLTPAQLADDLHLARSTVSNLLRDMMAADLVERRPSAVDGRSVLVHATDHARGLLTSFTRGRHELVRRALETMTDAERAPLVAALPSLDVLLRRLETVGGLEHERGGHH